MTAEPITTHTPWAEQEQAPELFGIFDEDKGDFVAAFISLRDAQEYQFAAERNEHDFGSRPVYPKYWPRYSVDQLPADHPLAESVRL